jgi:hypothetical protein
MVNRLHLIGEGTASPQLDYYNRLAEYALGYNLRALFRAYTDVHNEYTDLSVELLHLLTDYWCYP